MGAMAIATSGDTMIAMATPIRPTAISWSSCPVADSWREKTKTRRTA